MWKFEDGPEDAPYEGDPSDVGLAWIVTFAGDERISSEEVAEGQSITRAEARRLAEREGYELAIFDEILVGFDAREAGEHDPYWGDQRRQRFLLRHDVARPLSIDQAVWPTIFDGPWEAVPLLDGPGGKQKGDQVVWVHDRKKIGPNAPLWQNLERMKNKLDEEGADPAGIVLVAVGWCFRWNGEESPYPPDIRGYPIWGPYDMEEAEPAELEKSWDLLGCDVASGSLTSGLSNCGYTTEESARLREKWAPTLNAHHLFRDQDSAFAFVEVMNARVPCDAPFHVYSLYRFQ